MKFRILKVENLDEIFLSYLIKKMIKWSIL